MNNLDWNRNGVAWKGLEDPEDHKRRDGLAGRVEVGHRTEQSVSRGVAISGRRGTNSANSANNTNTFHLALIFNCKQN